MNSNPLPPPPSIKIPSNNNTTVPPVPPIEIPVILSPPQDSPQLELFEDTWPTTLQSVHRVAGTSDGVLLVHFPDRIIVLKSCARIGASVFAEFIAAFLKIQTPQWLIIRKNSQIWKKMASPSLKSVLKRRNVSHEIMENMPIDQLVNSTGPESLIFKAKYMQAMEYIHHESFSRRHFLSSKGNKIHSAGIQKLREMGRLLAYDMLCNNSDRMVLPLWNTKISNWGNLLISKHFGQIYAIDNSVLCINPKKSQSRFEIHLNKVLQIVDQVITTLQSNSFALSPLRTIFADLFFIINSPIVDSQAGITALSHGFLACLRDAVNDITPQVLNLLMEQIYERFPGIQTAGYIDREAVGLHIIHPLYFTTMLSSIKKRIEPDITTFRVPSQYVQWLQDREQYYDNISLSTVAPFADSSNIEHFKNSTVRKNSILSSTSSSTSSTSSTSSLKDSTTTSRSSLQDQHSPRGYLSSPRDSKSTQNQIPRKISALLFPVSSATNASVAAKLVTFELCQYYSVYLTLPILIVFPQSCIETPLSDNIESHPWVVEFGVICSRYQIYAVLGTGTTISTIDSDVVPIATTSQIQQNSSLIQGNTHYSVLINPQGRIESLFPLSSRGQVAKSKPLECNKSFGMFNKLNTTVLVGSDILNFTLGNGIRNQPLLVINPTLLKNTKSIGHKRPRPGWISSLDSIRNRLEYFTRPAEIDSSSPSPHHPNVTFLRCDSAWNLDGKGTSVLVSPSSSCLPPVFGSQIFEFNLQQNPIPFHSLFPFKPQSRSNNTDRVGTRIRVSYLMPNDRFASQVPVGISFKSRDILILKYPTGLVHSYTLFNSSLKAQKTSKLHFVLNKLIGSSSIDRTPKSHIVPVPGSSSNHYFQYTIRDRNSCFIDLMEKRNCILATSAPVIGSQTDSSTVDHLLYRFYTVAPILAFTLCSSEKKRSISPIPASISSNVIKTQVSKMAAILACGHIVIWTFLSNNLPITLTQLVQSRVAK